MRKYVVFAFVTTLALLPIHAQSLQSITNNVSHGAATDCTGGSDNFNRANAGSLGNGWTDINSGYTIASNAAVTITGGYGNLAYCHAAAGNDQFSQVTIVNDDNSGVGLRFSFDSMTDYISGYMCLNYNGTLTLWRVLNQTSFTSLGTYANGGGSAVVKISAQGTTIKCYLAGTERISVTDATYATGNPGLAVYGANMGEDNWTGGTFP